MTPLTDSERRYVETLITAIGGWRSIRSGACFRNAQRLLFHDRQRRLRYCESAQPFAHAWVTINKKIVDVTEEARARQLKRTGMPPHVVRGLREIGRFDYSRGVTINRRTVLRHVRRVNRWDSVLTMRKAGKQ
jgi:hypothetical protein